MLANKWPIIEFYNFLCTNNFRIRTLCVALHECILQKSSWKEEKMPKLNVQHLQRANSIPTDGKLKFIVRYSASNLTVHGWSSKPRKNNLKVRISIWYLRTFNYKVCNLGHLSWWGEVNLGASTLQFGHLSLKNERPSVSLDMY